MAEWRVHSILVNKEMSYVVSIFLMAIAIYILLYYFDIFFSRKRQKVLTICGCILFGLWQFAITHKNVLPGFINIHITVAITLLTVSLVYQGRFWKKCMFTFAFNAIWMLMETLCGYLLMIYFNHKAIVALQPLGSFFSEILFLLSIMALKRVFTDDEIKELPTKYSVMLILIPIGSIYIMNDIFMLSYQEDTKRVSVESAIAAIILFFMNIIIFYVYLKLTNELQLKRINSVYEKQLALSERHQQEKELSILQVRDLKHNMKNALISLLAYVEKGECEKAHRFIHELMEEEINTSAIINTGNIIIDSLVGYWHTEAEKAGIDFSSNIKIPMNMHFKGADICLILGNVLENAVEAAGKEEENKYIRLQMKYDRGNLILCVVNSYNGLLIKSKDKKLKSTKSNKVNHGIGLESMHRAAKRYHGAIVIDDSEPKRFLIRIVLYGDL